MADDPSCSSCGACEENMEHIFHSCPNAVVVWGSLVPHNKRNRFFSLPFDIWLMENLSDKNKTDYGDWGCLFGLVVRKLWSSRNEIVFQDASFNGSTIIAQCRAWERAVRFNKIKKLTVKNRVTKLIQWFAPASGCWKLNTDGAVKHSTKEASVGGVIRNSNGEWFLGYARRLGECSVLIAKLWAIYDCFKFAWEYNLRNVVVECDNITAVLMVNSRRNEGCNYSIVRHILALIDKHWYVEVKHVYREANRVADFIADWGLKMLVFRLLNDLQEALLLDLLDAAVVILRIIVEAGVIRGGSGGAGVVEEEVLVVIVNSLEGEALVADMAAIGGAAAALIKRQHIIGVGVGITQWGCLCVDSPISSPPRHSPISSPPPPSSASP
ncbi:hypothetical protein SASPL_137226 [Salvia splendens]|uniref:RNase H type-1 domain-containing protein n=1 Tax=Salvia splendens TaxID=180675 RepID=A0A8X8WUV1_SALSN|nr:hypothetical protein SASPL_137226 [Salvia splendens]